MKLLPLMPKPGRSGTARKETLQYYSSVLLINTEYMTHHEELGLDPEMQDRSFSGKINQQNPPHKPNEREKPI